MKQPKTAKNSQKEPSDGRNASTNARKRPQTARGGTIAPPVSQTDPETDTPAGLQPATAAWFASLREEYGLDDPAGLYLLEAAARAWDRAQEARRAIEKDGLRVKDRFKQWKAHPLCTVERDALAAFRGALKDLNLDLEPLRDRPGRPPGR